MLGLCNTMRPGARSCGMRKDTTLSVDTRFGTDGCTCVISSVDIVVPNYLFVLSCHLVSRLLSGAAKFLKEHR